MKQKTKLIIACVSKRVISFLLIALIFIGSFSCVVVSKKDLFINKKFQGEKAGVQGVLNLWLVSSFESGIASKRSFIEKIAIDFEKKYKGCYILVSVLSEDEYDLRINSQSPDIVCFSGNMGKKVEKNLCELEDNREIKTCLINSSKKNGVELYAYPWAIGGYALISSRSRIKRTSLGDVENVNLFSNIYNLGYEKTNKKSKKMVYSLAFGIKNKNNPLSVIYNESIIKGIVLNKLQNSFSEDYQNWTSYNAYESWVRGDSVILLGSQRDLARIQTREQQGKESDFFIEFMSNYTDLVDYIGVVENSNPEKKELSRMFSKFIVNQESQKKLNKIGLFSVLNLDLQLYNDVYFSKMEKSLQYLNLVPNIFDI